VTDAATPLVDVAQPAETPPSGEQTERSSRWAAWVFGAYVAAGLPLLVLGLGKFWWFFRDDWFFITDRDISYHGLIDDHNGHWSTVPVVAFRFLWSIFGLHTYAPYKASVVALHLVVVVCVRAVMRRYGVGPWLATVLAGVLVLFGAGREDILWAFQIGFTGSIALMYVQWVIADRDQAPIDRRDLLGVVCGILAVASSSPSIPIVAALSVTLLIRRGWRASVLHAAPPTAAYLLWSLLASPDRSSPWGSPPVSALFEWVENGLVSTVDDLTGHRWATVILALGVAAGTVLAVARPARPLPDDGPAPASDHRLVGFAFAARRRLRPVIGPIALFGATVLFILLAAQRAWIFGPAAASASRYIYAYAAFSMPLVAMAIQELARRWRPLAPLLALLLIIGVPYNIERFRDPVFGPAHHAHQRDLLLNVVRSPAMAHAPDDVRPDPDGFNSPGLTVGFFRWAEAHGKLPEITTPIPSVIEAELTIRLGLDQDQVTEISPCEPTTLTEFEPEVGTSFYLSTSADVRARDHVGAQWPTRLRQGDGPKVTVLAPDLDLEIRSEDGGPATICIID